MRITAHLNACNFCAVLSFTHCEWITPGIFKSVTAESAKMVGMQFFKMYHMNEVFFFSCMHVHECARKQHYMSRPKI